MQFDKDVRNMVQMFEGRFIDPFDLSDPSDHLVDIAPPELEVSLLNALDRGSQMTSNFRKERLIPSDSVKPLKRFYDPLPKSGVKTMANMQTTVRVQYCNNFIV